MEAKRAVRWAAYYRGIATLSFIVGMGITAYGFSAGLGETIDILINNYPAQQQEAEAAANVPLAAGSVVVGVLVWQVGKSIGFYWTLASAVDDATETDGAPAAAPAREPTDPDPRPAATAGASRATGRDTAGPADESAAPTDDPTTTGTAAGRRDEPGRPGTGRDTTAEAGGDESESTPDAGTRTGTPTAGDEGAARTGTAPSEEADDQRASADAESDDSAAAASRSDESTAAASVPDDDTGADDAGAEDTPDGVACPDCGYPNKEDVSFCMNCGAEL
ncbi:zinc ribbon domain-containing protein [Halostella litorea]|uniref:zinc ribbon domain-containing protein n=1 Tax=Halostella litorea TaxID=2528831 RepID=UPI0013870503|nr:zinc ribbon domain-containing protein [Halostella litorea]